MILKTKDVVNKMKKKICIFTAHYLPYLGGVENYTYNLSKTLVKQGDDVVIVTSNDMHLKVYEVQEGLLIYRMPCFNFMNGRIPILKVNKEFLQIQRRLKKYKFDLVLINTRFYPHTLYGVWLANKLGVRCIILDHGTSHITVGNALADWSFSVAEHTITFLEKRFCRSFFGVSKACCEWLKHFRINAEGVLYNAVDIEKIDQLLENPVRDFRKEYNLQVDTRIIAYTGRLLKEKGVLELAEAVRTLPKEENVYLFIAGDGEEMSEVKAVESTRIRALGRLSFAEVISLLSQADIYCLPTRYPEGFPTAVLEAAAAGCYVITTDRGGSKELIRDNSYGMILDEPTPEKIREAIKMALHDEIMRTEASEKANQCVRENFVWSCTADKVHKLADITGDNK